jgi:hypothetical protein
MFHGPFLFFSQLGQINKLPIGIDHIVSFQVGINSFLIEAAKVTVAASAADPVITIR